MNGIFDSHAHYDDERFDADRDELLQRIHREGVEYIMTIGSDLASSRAACRLAERYDFIWFAAGIHPEQAGDAPADYREALKELAAHPKCRAIGEIGLDYYWAENPPRERQQVLFREQVLLAKELGLPLREGVLARDGRATAHAAEGRAARIALAQESYRAGSRRLPPGEHILLIDDIITTGATIEKCAGLLKAQGAGTVTAAAVLRTPRPEEKKPAEKL